MPEVAIGERFTRLVVLAEAPSRGHGRYYLCRCDCGKETVASAYKLTIGRTKSCGCWKRDRATVHGCARDFKITKAYKAWCGIKARCTNENSEAYKDYGGRGITVCERWLHSFENFLADMGDPPDSSMSIDRHPNNDGNYEPGNCRWASRKEQQNNRRNNVVIEMNGRTQTLKQWCEELGLNFNTVLYRTRRGWSAERALTEPIGEWRGRQRRTAS